MAPLQRWCSDQLFRWVHNNNLIYNTCWEDPRLDRQALKIGPSDTMMVITSAGCNVLDYLLDRPQAIHAVDVNPRQNALLNLKIAGIRNLDFETFFQIFGVGHTENFHYIYRKKLRPALDEAAQKFWDNSIDYFTGMDKARSFYFRGTSGFFARLVHYYIDALKLRVPLTDLFNAQSIEEQRDVYDQALRQRLWKPVVRWAMNRSSILSLLGVPRAQKLTIENTYAEGIYRFVRDSIEGVFTKLSIQDNYFWALYFFGRYTPTRCPNYLKEENFNELKSLVDRVQTHTIKVTEFLNSYEGNISRYVLLDHMDWLSHVAPEQLQAEWQAISDRSSEDTRLIWRSGGMSVDYVDPIIIKTGSSYHRVGDRLDYQTELAQQLHVLDRVHTYGSFYVAQMVA